jgi:hypothetical protein
VPLRFVFFFISRDIDMKKRGKKERFEKADLELHALAHPEILFGGVNKFS